MQAIFKLLCHRANVTHEPVTAFFRTKQADVDHVSFRQKLQICPVGDQVVTHDDRRIELIQIKHFRQRFCGTTGYLARQLKIAFFDISRSMILNRYSPAQINTQTYHRLRVQPCAQHQHFGGRSYHAVQYRHGFAIKDYSINN